MLYDINTCIKKLNMQYQIPNHRPKVSKSSVLPTACALDCCGQWLSGSTQVSIVHSCRKTIAVKNF